MEILGHMKSTMNLGSSVPDSRNNNVGNKTVDGKADENPELKEELKEASREMFKEHRVLGDWKDKEGLEEITDPTLGGDIRYALKSRNIDYLKRLQKGNLTIGELREVTHRIRELEQTQTKNSNIFDGKIIEVKA